MRSKIIDPVRSFFRFLSGVFVGLSLPERFISYLTISRDWLSAAKKYHEENNHEAEAEAVIEARKASDLAVAIFERMTDENKKSFQNEIYKLDRDFYQFKTSYLCNQ